MNSTLIQHLLASPVLGQACQVSGWIRTRRTSKAVSFLDLNDGSCLRGLQLVIADTLPNYQDVLALQPGAAITATGVLAASPGREQTVELQVQTLAVQGFCDITSYPLQKKRISFEVLRELAHLRPRTNTFGAVARVRNSLSFATHRFFQERGFLYVHAPIITASDCEGAGEMFRVTTLDAANPPRRPDGTVDWAQDFFGRAASLTVSGQLAAETQACALGRVYTFGPTFRAENSTTTRHLAEFWMIEPEMAFADLNDDAALAEAYLKYLVQYALEHNAEDLAFFNQHIEPELTATLGKIAGAESFRRLTYTEAVAALGASGKTFEFPVQWGMDLQTEHERYLTEEYCHAPVIVTDYPKQIKAFYMRQNDDGKTVAAMDVLFPRIGEIIGGSQREERLAVLEARLRELGLPVENYWWYLDLRRYGTVPHAGFGLGFERLVQFVTGLGNIRDVIPFPRTPKHAEF